MQSNPSVRFPSEGIPEPRLIFPSFNYDTAFTVGLSIRDHFLSTYPNVGAAGGPGIVIQISLFSGHVLFGVTVGNGPLVGPANWDWARGKVQTVRKSGVSSWEMKQRLEKIGKAPAEFGYPFPEFAVAGGGVPIWVKGVDAGPIGCVIVSGLPQREDHQLIVSDRGASETF